MEDARSLRSRASKKSKKSCMSVKLGQARNGKKSVVTDTELDSRAGDFSDEGEEDGLSMGLDASCMKKLQEDLQRNGVSFVSGFHA